MTVPLSIFRSLPISPERKTEMRRKNLSSHLFYNLTPISYEIRRPEVSFSGESFFTKKNGIGKMTLIFILFIKKIGDITLDFSEKLCYTIKNTDTALQ